MISVIFMTIGAGASIGIFFLVWLGINRLQISNPKTSIEPLSISSVMNLEGRSWCLRPSFLSGLESSLGQGVVEFTLVFLLFIVIAWIPADFGLAFYTGQLALNASREGARIAAADPTLATGTTTCTLPACYSLADGTILKETAKRISSALMPGTQISVIYPAPGGVSCNQQLVVNVTGNYNFFFYRLLRLFGADVPFDVRIIRSTQMRWEHQNTCA